MSRKILCIFRYLLLTFFLKLLFKSNNMYEKKLEILFLEHKINTLLVDYFLFKYSINK